MNLIIGNILYALLELHERSLRMLQRIWRSSWFLPTLLIVAVVVAELLIYGPAARGNPQSGAPALPDGIAVDERLTWRPTLDPQATVTVDGNTVTDWRTGSPSNVLVPSNRSSLGVALELCANNDGDWVGFTGSFPYELTIGSSKDGPRDVGRPEGFQGVSLIGLDEDAGSSMRSQIRGVHFAQGQGINQDIALIGFIVDSHSIMPIQTTNLARSFGHLYLERLRFLTISNDQTGKTPTTRVIRGHGGAAWHILNCQMVDGLEIGDGLAGASEHFLYYDGQMGPSEVVGCWLRGPQWAGIQAVGRYTDRFQDANGVWQERFPVGALLIEDCKFENVGSAGTACINITGGGLLDVTVKNCTYSAGFIQTGGSGQVGPNGWLGMAIQTYTDHKAWELDDVNYLPGQGPKIARGYSMEPIPNLPESAGPPPLPADGFGACRSIRVIGGTWLRNGGGSPLFSFRDCADVTIVQQGVAFGGGPTLPLTLSGGPIMFAHTGVLQNNGKAGEGSVPSGVGPGYWQQATFVGRRAPSTWITVPVKMGAARKTLSVTDLDSWWEAQ